MKIITIEKYGITGYDTDRYMNVTNHTDKLFVYGDNLKRYGKGGQAIIRDELNAFGIAVKRKPSTAHDAYFNDNCEICRYTMLDDIRRLYKISKRYDAIVFPNDGIGTGLAKLPIVAPTLFNLLSIELYNRFGIVNGGGYDI